MVNLGCLSDWGRVMRNTFPRSQHGRADALAVTLRILLAFIFAASLSYCSVVIEQAKALLAASLFSH